MFERSNELLEQAGDEKREGESPETVGIDKQVLDKLQGLITQGHNVLINNLKLLYVSLGIGRRQRLRRSHTLAE